MKYKVPFIKPELPSAQELSDYYQQIVDFNWFSNFGPLEQELCNSTENYIGQSIHSTTISNATIGLMLALKALVPSTNEKMQVLIPAFTFAAGAEAIIWCGHEPVFIDIDKTSWQPDLTQATEYLNQNHSKVAGILFCNVFGVGATEIDDWEMLAEKFDIPLVIDSAAGFGSEYKNGNKLGAKGDCEIFSFHVTKPFGVGEGGAITSRSKDTIEKIRAMSNFGFDKKREVTEVGLNGKMQEINAAIGLWQLERIDDRIKKHQKILNKYKNALEPFGFVLQENHEKSSVCFVSVLAPGPDLAQKLFDALREGGVEVNRYYNPPLHKHPAFSKYEIASSLNNTEDICSRIVSLPSHDMVGEEVFKVIKEALGK